MATSGKSRKMFADESRQRISATKLITSLMNHATGKKDMKSTQIRAAEILLKKVVPDLSTTTIQGDLRTTVIRKNLAGDS